jgi:anti-sigma factor RsiW
MNPPQAARHLHIIVVAMGSCGDAGAPSSVECRQIAELLGDYLDGTLPNHTRELIEFHIEGCGPCVSFVNTYRGTIAATRRLPDAAMPNELKKRLLRVLREQRTETPPHS